MSTEEDPHDGDAARPIPVASSLKHDSPVAGLLVLGGVLVLAGIIGGFALASRVAPQGCDTTFQSCSHPHMALGLILVGASLFAGVLLAVTGVVAQRVVGSLPPRRA
jgi:hypothetical protein